MMYFNSQQCEEALQERELSANRKKVHTLFNIIIQRFWCKPYQFGEIEKLMEFYFSFKTQFDQNRPILFQILFYATFANSNTIGIK
jgi:hypothetical protein